MRRWVPCFLVLLLLLAGGPARAQDDEATPEGDDQNPFNLSADERASIKKFDELAAYAIRSLQERDFEGAERRYKKLIAKLDQDTDVNAPTRRRMLSYAHYNLACNYSLDGKTEPALEEFEKSLELGFWGWKHIKKDTDLDNVRDEEGFKESVRKWRKAEAQAFVDSEQQLIAQVTSSLAANRSVVKPYDFSITSTSGDELERSALKGKVVVFHVFHPYSEDGVGPEIAALVKLHHEYKKKGVVVIGITPVPNANVGQWLDKFVDENEIKFPLAAVRPADPTFKPYNESYGQTVLWVLDKRGKVRGTAERLKSYEALEKVVQTLLDAPVPEKKKAPAKE